MDSLRKQYKKKKTKRKRENNSNPIIPVEETKKLNLFQSLNDAMGIALATDSTAGMPLKHSILLIL